jgi:LacI family transcriptional regulator
MSAFVEDGTEPAARRPTMRDVASRAEVSLKTVSRVVNGESGVRASLAERVRQAIEDLDFRPNVGASALRRTDGKTRTVGLLLEDVANPFSSALLRAVEDVAVSRGVLVFAASLDEDPTRERELARMFSARRADGLIIAPAGEDLSYMSGEQRAGTAIVCVDREARGLAADSVMTTNTTGATEGVHHLAAAGHTRIAFVGDRRSIVTAQLRYEGYADGLRLLGLPLDPSIVVHDVGDVVRADGAVTALLSGPNPPTALFTAQNLVTMGAIRALRRVRRQHEVALVGFDDFLLADLLEPGVTVVAQDPVAIGRTAAQILFSRLAGQSSPFATHIVPTMLVRRGSGEIPPPR